MRVIPYGRQSITKEDIEAVTEVLECDYLTQGPKIGEFEKAFASYVGSKYAVAVANGTAALHLCALSLGVGEGSKVITTPITFVASANCVRYCGGDLQFVDIDPQTYNLDINKVRELLKSSPKGTYQGIIPVNFAGYPVDMEAFKELADEYGLWIIEDACHAPGGSFTDRKNVLQKCGKGNYADLAIFSFHPVKHIACGEGGMITTNNKELYEKLMVLRTHGINQASPERKETEGGWLYEQNLLGYNYRLTDMQAALGISQLKRAEEGLKRRREIANKYDEAFKNSAIKTPFRDSSINHAFHLYVIQTPRRKELYEFLRTKNIFTQVHYIPVHTQPYYSQLGFKKGDFRLAEAYYERCLSLPMYPSLNEADQQHVIDCVLEFHS
jgi:UDP-4-amino-4,6-dideoxy-N-acetyl-beta-L-altrosamine transaminase